MGLTKTCSDEWHEWWVSMELEPLTSRLPDDSTNWTTTSLLQLARFFIQSILLNVHYCTAWLFLWTLTFYLASCLILNSSFKLNVWQSGYNIVWTIHHYLYVYCLVFMNIMFSSLKHWRIHILRPQWHPNIDVLKIWAFTLLISFKVVHMIFCCLWVTVHSYPNSHLSIS